MGWGVGGHVEGEDGLVRLLWQGKFFAGGKGNTIYEDGRTKKL